MSAYVISELTEIHSQFIAEYLALARPSISLYGGRYLASTASIEMLEGADAPLRYVIVEFESVERARAWYHSDAYAAALKVRSKALARRLMIVDGKVD